MSKVLSPSWMVVVMPEVSASSYFLGSGNHLLLFTFGAAGTGESFTFPFSGSLISFSRRLRKVGGRL
jgi:hypothetical protein